MVARRAAAGESVEALNEKTYTLDETMTVIADDSGVHDIGGIMGGAHSGAADDTCDVLLEIAYFDPERIGVTGRKLGLASDARTRFERGVDPAGAEPGMEIASRMILDLCGGEASAPVFAGAEPDDVASGGLQFRGLLGHGHGRRGFDAGKGLGDDGHEGRSPR